MIFHCSYCFLCFNLFMVQFFNMFVSVCTHVLKCTHIQKEREREREREREKVLDRQRQRDKISLTLNQY